MAVRVDVARLVGSAGERRELTHAVVIDGLRHETSRVRDEAAIDCVLVVESILGGIEVHGSLGVDWVGECRRCLDDVVGRLRVDVREIFEDEPVEGETYPIDDDHIELEAMLREIVMLALPLSPLCRHDCAGPDPARFPTGPAAGAADRERDPRWAALDGLDLP